MTVRTALRAIALVGPALLVLAACTSPTPDGHPAARILAVPGYVRFDGASTAQVSITADGAWTAETDQGWLSVSQTAGSGDATVTLSVDRTGLPVGDYAASVLLRGAEPLEVVTVSMRFPSLSGTVSDLAGKILPQSIAPGGGPGRSPPASFLTSGRDYAPGRVLVALDRGMTAAISRGSGLVPAGTTLTSADVLTAARTLTEDHGLTLGRVLGSAVPLVVVGTSHAVEDAVRDLEGDARVAHVEPDYLYRPLWVPADPDYGLQWDMPQIGMPAAWDVTLGSADVTVAVIDNGFVTNHVDLAANMLSGYDFGDGDGDPSTSAGDDCGEHGTHVAGTVAAVAGNGVGIAGVAPGVRLLPLKIGQSLPGCPLPSSALITALYYAAGYDVAGAGALTKPVDAVNLSLGTADYSLLLDQAVTAAALQGVTVVTAAGNTGAGLLYPAALATTIAVGAVDRNGVRAPYSAYGPALDVVAPGGDMSASSADGIYSTGPSATTFQYMQGTSMASPHVAGLVGLMRSVDRALGPDDVRVLLRGTATDLGAAGFDDVYGAGLIDAAAAVQAARVALTANASDLLVRLRQGATVVAQVRADAAGRYALAGIAAGSYTLEAGTDVDHDGVLGEGGEFYAGEPVTVDYTGDRTVNLTVAPR